MKLSKFLSLIVAGVLCVSMAACSTTPKEEPPKQGETPQTETLETDVLVVGGGLAGVSAAIKAKENGANVILIEKMAMLGGSSAYSGGGIGAVNTTVQKEYGVEDSTESWLELWHQRQDTSYVKELYPDYQKVEKLIDRSAETIDWMLSLGYEFRAPEGFGVDPVLRLHYIGPEGGGAAMMSFLGDAAQEKGVEVYTETSAVSLIQDDTGAVTGVIAENAEGSVQINAKAVILASGGFARSQEMLERFTPEVADYEKYSVSASGNTGDGIRMAEEVGAVVYEDPWLIGLGLTTPVNELKGFYWYGNYIFVNKEGSRFTNEAAHYAIVFNDAVYQSAGGSYMIFDSGAAFESYVAAAETVLDNEAVFKAETLAELAEATGMNTETLQATLDSYNAGAASGNDEFGKPAQLLMPMETGPYYAVEWFPSSMGTFGGVKCDDNQQVLNAEGATIAGLYAAGEMANRPYYAQVYMSGSALQVATQTGQIAGEAAALSIK